MNLLIVDDELWSRELVKKLLDWKTLGFTTLKEASNGQEALTILKRDSIDLTITDMRMSGIDGAELLQQIREKNYATEVIVMSGYDHYEFLHEAIKTKAIDYILKPIDETALLKAVKTAMNRIIDYQNHHKIEHILLREDLKDELHLYFELKSNLFKSLTTLDQTTLINTLEKLEDKLFLATKNTAFKSFMNNDLKRLLIRMQKDYFMSTDYSQLEDLTLPVLQEELLKIYAKIKEKRINRKIDMIDVQQYIEQHFTEPISLSSVADIFHVSKEHLSRLFKQEVNVTVQNYIINKRIDYAKMLLTKHQRLSISTISVMSGYPDLQYFYRVFKRKTHLTPKAYRDKISI